MKSVRGLYCKLSINQRDPETKELTFSSYYPGGQPNTSTLFSYKVVSLNVWPFDVFVLNNHLYFYQMVYSSFLYVFVVPRTFVSVKDFKHIVLLYVFSSLVLTKLTRTQGRKNLKENDQRLELRILLGLDRAPSQGLVGMRSTVSITI